MIRIKVGTRGSLLSRKQTEIVLRKIKDIEPDIDFEIVIIRTKGDKIIDSPLHKIQGKGFFVREIEKALLSGDIDIAVHSLKDIPSDIPSGLHIAAVPERHNPYDAFVSAGFKLLESPDGARIGTSSVRREVQLKNLLKKVNVVPLRGNIDTRLRKVKEGIIDAAVVAYAGLERMGWEDEAVEVISDDIMLPAAGQGAVAVEVRDDFKYQQIIEAINDHKTIIETGAERTFIKQISGGCNVPVGVIARLSEGLIRIKGGIFGMFGRESVCVKKEAQGNPEDSVKIAEKLAEGILEAGGLEILRRIRAQAIP